MTFLLFWSYVKKYWSYVALALAIIFGYLLFKRRDTNFADSLKKIQDAHDEEIKKIQEIRATEKKLNEENVKKLEETLAVVQKHYDDEKKKLDEKKKAEVEELVTKYSDNPDELAKKLSEATGFKIVLPE